MPLHFDSCHACTAVLKAVHTYSVAIANSVKNYY